MILVDTGAWFALSVPADPDHSAAKLFAQSNHEQLVTTDFIVDELLTLFRVRRQTPRAIQWLDDVLAAGGTKLVQVSSADFERATEIYRHYSDKEWSFTDCTSLAVIERLQISCAFAFDEHFRQFGSIAVLP
jgi:predicted nucleic acid-binding protein